MINKPTNVRLLPATLIITLMTVGVLANAQGVKASRKQTGASPSGALPTTLAQPARSVEFTRDVRPILAANCFPCHGLDEKKRAANLRLDVRESAIGPAASGARAIAPGKPNLSAMLARVRATHALQMPPEATGKRLTVTQIATLEAWIKQGATYEPFWAFRKPTLPNLPVVSPTNQAKVRNPIDKFVLAKLEKNGLTLSPEADRHTLLRRVSLDLVGLPPTQEEVKAFISDTSKDAYERAVDRLLASPHFGEKWARPWMDLARFANSAGYGSDPLRPNLWPYRDWVINAFNRDLPYDRFVTEQLAGDLLPNPTQDQLVATAFHRNTMTNTEGGTSREEFRTAAVKDRAITTVQVFMGLTMGCAQCHSHKFDPITNREFYRFMAFFNQTEDNDQPNEAPTMPYLPEEQQKRSDGLKAEIAALKGKLGTDPGLKMELDSKEKELAGIKPVALPIMKELPASKKRVSHVLVLANFLQPTEEVTPGTPASFPPMPAGAPSNRLGVAQWITSPDNPLTARVAVNRLWAQLFGTGLVETEEDFGNQGSLPSHPELLDWLAVQFQTGTMSRPATPWSMKSLLRLIVSSATYRQQSKVTPLLLEKDPRNRLLARYPRRRLDAEGIRDQALAISGLLSQKIGGPSVFPPQPAGLWQAAFNGDRNYPTSTGADRYRRGLYTFWRRTVPHPSMAAFDAPSREICTIRRMPTNTPLQALVTLNDPVFVEIAQACGRRIVLEGGDTVEQRARFALSLALARPPRPEEVQTIVSLVAKEMGYYQAHPEDAARLATDPLGPLPDDLKKRNLTVAEMASWTVVANVLFNLDGVLNKS